jgi:hypothetical protein
MIVKVGFNTDFGKDKFDVGLDETDLARILTEAGIPPDALLTEIEAFQVLHATAERLCAAKQVVLAGGAAGRQTPESDRWRGEVNRLGDQVTAQLGKIRARLGLLPGEQ